MKNNKNFALGITLICIAATLSSISQLLWKIGTDGTWGIVWYLAGFVFSGLGMVLMMLAFRFGEVSVLQPLMSLGFALSIILGWVFLGESLSWPKILGTACIIIGAAILSKPTESEVQ